MQQDVIDFDWSKITPSVKDFLDVELDKCRSKGIRINIPKSKEVLHNGMHCAGYFDDQDLEFAVAYNRRQCHWLATFVHESCHVDQWIDQMDLWNTQIDGKDPLVLFDEWLTEKENVEEHVLQKVVDVITGIELDCEQRSVQKIKSYGLPINTVTYTKKSNAYVWSYRLVQQTCNWDHCALHEYPKVWKLMPKHFNNDYTVLPTEIAKVFYDNLPL